MSIKSYLGDGVYAEFDGFGITISTPRHDGTHHVYFEPSTLTNLNKYIERVYNCKITVTKNDDPEAMEKKDENMP